MTPAELRTLPVGTELYWPEMQHYGEIIDRAEDSIKVRWQDGQECFAWFDADFEEFAGAVELADVEPVVLER